MNYYSELFNKYKHIHHFFGDKKLDLHSIPDRTVFMEQIHGENVEYVKDTNSLVRKKTDGLLTTKKYFLGIITADCLPVFIYDTKSNTIGAIHAGRSGIEKGIMKIALNKLKNLKRDLKTVKITVGPHIRKCCYKVQNDIAHLFDALYPGSIDSSNPDKRYFLDLEKCITDDCMGAGIPAGNIDIMPLCTCCNDNFYSHRRNKNSKERNISIIGLI